MKTVVIGAGISGLSVAHELVRNGVETVVLDSGEVGQEASAGNAGWITPFLSTPRAAPGVVRDAVGTFLAPNGPARVYPRAEVGFGEWALGFLKASTQKRHTQNAQALRALGARALEEFDQLTELGVTFEQHRQGLSLVARQSQSMEDLRELVSTARKSGYQGEILTLRGSDLADFDSAIARDVAGVVHLVDERHVDPETLTKGLAEAVSAKGGEVVTRERVVSIQEYESRWKVMTQSGRAHRADKIVVAAGFGSRAVLSFIDVRLPLEAASGTSLTAYGEGTAPRHALKLYESMVACSPFNGSVRLSGTYDVGQRSAKVNRRRLESMTTAGLQYLNDWRPTGIKREWAGLRPTSPDDLPIVGHLSSRPGVHLATGHGTLGITLAPTTGRLLGHELATGQHSPELDPFRPGRFRTLR